MNYIEFLEGLARLADTVSFPPATDDYKMKFEILIDKKRNLKSSSSISPNKVDDSSSEEETKNFEDMSVEDRVNQPLHKKIENILPNLLLY